MKIEDAVKNVFAGVEQGQPLKMPDLVKATLAQLASDGSKFPTAVTEEGAEVTVSDRIRNYVHDSNKYEAKLGKGGGVYRAGEAPIAAPKKPSNPLSAEKLEARIAKMQATLAARKAEMAPAPEAPMA